MPKVTEPPIFGFFVLMPLRPGPLVTLAPARPSPNVPARAAPAPSASPPARNDRRSNPCDIATPQKVSIPHDYGLPAPPWGATAAGYNSVTDCGGHAPIWQPDVGTVDQRRTRMAIAVGDKI